MALVKEGDTIRIHYTGKLTDGTVFDTSEGGASLEFKVGGGEFLAALEKGVIGMKIGDSRTLLVPAEEAYGLHNKERIFEYDRSRLPEDFNATVGQQVMMYRADGLPVTVVIVGATDTSVTMDCNHPLAGKDLTFDITLEEIL